MRRSVISLSLVLALLLINSSSCHTSSKAVNEKSAPTTTRNYTAEGFVKATVVRFDVDGCKWLVQLENGTKMVPEKLPPEFGQDGLKVWVKYEVKKGAMGICMAGDIVTVKAIEKRE